MKQQGLKFCFGSAPWGRVIVMAGGVTRKDAGVESVVKALHPAFPGVVEGLQVGFVEMFQDEVSLDELKAALDLTFGLGSVAVDDADCQAGHVVLEVRNAPRIGRFKLAALVREDSFRQSVAHEGAVKAGKDIDFQGPFHPASRQQIARAVVFDQDEVAVADFGEADFSHEVDLPQVIGPWGLKMGDGFDGRQGDAVELMLNEGAPDSYLVNSELEVVSDPAGRAMQALPFGLYDSQFVVNGELVVVAVPMLAQPLGALLEKTFSIPPQGP